MSWIGTDNVNVPLQRCRNDRTGRKMDSGDKDKRGSSCKEIDIYLCVRACVCVYAESFGLMEDRIGIR